MPIFRFDHDFESYPADMWLAWIKHHRPRREKLFRKRELWPMERVCSYLDEKPENIMKMGQNPEGPWIFLFVNPLIDMWTETQEVKAYLYPTKEFWIEVGRRVQEGIIRLQ